MKYWGIVRITVKSMYTYLWFPTVCSIPKWASDTETWVVCCQNTEFQVISSIPYWTCPSNVISKIQSTLIFPRLHCYFICGGCSLITKYTSHRDTAEDWNTCSPSVFMSREMCLGLAHSLPWGACMLPLWQASLFARCTWHFPHKLSNS